LDDAEEPEGLSSLLESNDTDRSGPVDDVSRLGNKTGQDVLGGLAEDIMDVEDEDEDGDDSGDEDDYSIDDEDEEDDEASEQDAEGGALIPDLYSRVPSVLPQARYAGACNVETVKDGMFVTRLHRVPQLTLCS
jgi:hypothetical protein